MRTEPRRPRNAVWVRVGVPGVCGPGSSRRHQGGLGTCPATFRRPQAHQLIGKMESAARRPAFTSSQFMFRTRVYRVAGDEVVPRTLLELCAAWRARAGATPARRLRTAGLPGRWRRHCVRAPGDDDSRRVAKAPCPQCPPRDREQLPRRRVPGFPVRAGSPPTGHPAVPPQAGLGPESTGVRKPFTPLARAAP